MDPFITFFLEHWILSGTFILISILFLANEWRYRTLGLATVTPLQLVNLLNHAHANVLDVRTSDDFEKGHILHGINIPKDQLNEKINSLNKYKMKPLIIVCEQGLISPKVGENLRKQGFTNLYCLNGGMQAWRTNNMPITKK